MQTPGQRGTPVEESKPKTSTTYTCSEYREEMILLGLNRQLQRPDLTAEDQARLRREIARVERQMGL
jgi:hypothetical protein